MNFNFSFKRSECVEWPVTMSLRVRQPSAARSEESLAGSVYISVLRYGLKGGAIMRQGGLYSPLAPMSSDDYYRGIAVGDCKGPTSIWDWGMASRAFQSTVLCMYC